MRSCRVWLKVTVVTTVRSGRGRRACGEVEGHDEVVTEVDCKIRR